MLGYWWCQETIGDPDHPAVLDTDGRIHSRRQFAEAVNNVAASLYSHSVNRGDRLAMVMKPGPDLATALIGAMSVAVVAPLAPSLPVAVFIDRLARLRATQLVVDHDPPEAVVEAALTLGIPILEIAPFGEPGPALALPNPDSADLALLLETAGTAGVPKVVPLSHGNLRAAAGWVADTFALGPADRSLAIMPLYHSMGIISTLLTPLLSGGSVICCRANPPDHIAEMLTRLEPTWLSSVPTVFHVLLTQLERDGCAPSHRLRFLRSAGSAMPPQLLARLESYFHVPVLEGYGLTEAYSACSNRFDGRGPTRRAGTVGPPAGAEVAILDPQGEHLKPGIPGEIVIRGASATLGYETGPSGWIRDAHGERWFASGDEGYFDAQGRLVLTGRLKEMINRGGQKVVPRRVDEALLEHPAVAEVIAFAVPHETLGQDLLAAVVLETGSSADEQELRRHAFERLAAHEVPSRIVLVGALPYSDTGKPQRIGLAEQLGDALFSSRAPAVGEMETLITDTFADVLEQSRPGRDANFFSLGGDSLSGQRVMLRLGASLGLELSPGLLFAHPDARGLGRRLDRLLDEALAGFDETFRPQLTSQIDGGR